MTCEDSSSPEQAGASAEPQDYRDFMHDGYVEGFAHEYVEGFARGTPGQFLELTVLSTIEVVLGC